MCSIYGRVSRSPFSLRIHGRSGQARVHHADLYGEREAKYETLSEKDVSNTYWERYYSRNLQTTCSSLGTMNLQNEYEGIGTR